VTPAQIVELLSYLGDDEKRELDRILAASPVWSPLPGPQAQAYFTDADVIGFGGAAGGGKTDLACGKALTQHKKILILRRDSKQLQGIVDRLRELIGHDDGFNSTKGVWRLENGQQVELGSCLHAEDWNKYQGRPHDLLVFDEAANFLEVQVRALMGWLRSTDPKQKCQTLLTFNPPTTASGRWIINFFAPWLDKKYPKPAKAGEVRYVASINGIDVWVEKNAPFVLCEGRPVYEFDKKRYRPEEIIRPQGRTFIPSRVTDNPYLMGTGYVNTLQALPEPLRSQMLKGDFNAGIEDDPWQVIPTAWVEQAQARWKPLDRLPEMTSLGVDVARGGRDNTVIYCRHGMWFGRALCFPGAQTPDGPATAGLVISAQRDKAPIHIDVIGVGSSPYDFLKELGLQVLGINVAEKSEEKDKSGRLGFKNMRSELWWRMREALDPAHNTGIALPPDPELLADLCAPTWRLQGSEIYVESREDIVKRIGRSPDHASALILANINTPKIAYMQNLIGSRRKGMDYDPY
jgi:hypothetical protein